MVVMLLLLLQLLAPSGVVGLCSGVRTVWEGEARVRAPT